MAKPSTERKEGVSPVSDDGRGLKPQRRRGAHQLHLGSPVSDDGRGLKQIFTLPLAANELVSPVSDDGRGLKLPVSGAVKN